MIQAIILSKDHRIYKGTWQSALSLQVLKENMALKGIKLDSPCGNRPPLFCFICDDTLPGEAMGSPYKSPDWIPLREALLNSQDIWSFYCEAMLGNWYPPTKNLDVFYFGSEGLLASKLAHLVAKGQKRLTAGWVASHVKGGIPIPEAGCVSIVTDGFGIPQFCIETENVKTLKFKDVTEAMAFREGEGDLSLDDWMREHWDYWTDHDAKEFDLTFYEDEEIFVEAFRLLHVFSYKSKWDRPSVTMIVGPTGAGKSTLASKISREQKLQLFSLDKWMRSLYWMDSNKESNLDWALERCRRCEAMIESLLQREIELGRGAVLDLGFSKAKDRVRWKEKLLGLGASVNTIWVDAPKDVRWLRVETRNQNLSLDALSVAVDRATFDWMETFYEPQTPAELEKK
jgi:uncharacterized protein YhfF/predicted kinase